MGDPRDVPPVIRWLMWLVFVVIIGKIVWDLVMS